MKFDWQLDDENVREVAIRHLVEVSVFGFVMMFFFNLKSIAIPLLGFVTILSLAGLLSPSWVRPYFAARLGLGDFVQWCFSSLVLLFTFFLVLFPVALVVRMFRKDPLKRQFDKTASSYWNKRTEKPGPKKYFRQY